MASQSKSLKKRGGSGLRMGVADESGKAWGTIEKLFQEEFSVKLYKLEALNELECVEDDYPHIILYICTRYADETAMRLKNIRDCWPKTILVMLAPTIADDRYMKELSNAPVHKIIYSPCSKTKIVDVVNNYLSLISDSDARGRDSALLNSLLEYFGTDRPELYVAYNRVTPLIMSVCGKVGFDWHRVQKVFSLLMLVLVNLEEELVASVMYGEGRKAKRISELYDNISKMVDLLKMNPVTEGVAEDLRYVLKRYDGDGLPKDDVVGFEIPPASRIIRLLFDYNYLLQSGKSSGQALYILSRRKGWYDDVLLHALVEVVGIAGERFSREVYPLGLLPGMVVAEDVYGSIDGKRVKVIAKDEILTEESVDYLQRNSAAILDVTEPIKVVEDLFTEEPDDA